MNQPNQVKRDIRSLERFIASAGHAWPADLCVAAGYALLALKTLDQPNVPPVLVRMAATDLANFTTAYTAHAASRSPDHEQHPATTPHPRSDVAVAEQ